MADGKTPRAWCGAEETEVGQRFDLRKLCAPPSEKGAEFEQHEFCAPLRGWPCVNCRSRLGSKGQKSAPAEAARCILIETREAKMEIPGYRSGGN